MANVQIRDEAHWRELRAAHVGGSEIAALFDESPHTTRFELWHQKAGNIPAPDLSENERVTWGQIIEPAIAEGVRRLKGWNVRKVHRYITSDAVPGMGASLDFEIFDHPDGPGVMDAKNVDRLVARDWLNDEPPLAYLLQIQQQMALTGRAWGCVSCLIGGNELRIFTYRRREKVIAAIEREVAAFWRSLAAGIPPKPNFDADLPTIQALYGSAGAGPVDMSGDNRLAEICANYVAAGADEREAKRRKDAAKAEILTKIGAHDRVALPGFSISAREIAGGDVAYARQPYRDFRIHQMKDQAA